MQLKTKEKFEFLKLAQYLAKIDGNYGEKEKELIDEYCCEMGIDNLEFDTSAINLEKVLTEFHSVKSKKIVLMALLVLTHVDDTYNFTEENTIRKICKEFKIDDKEYSTISNLGKAVSALRAQAIQISLN